LFCVCWHDLQSEQNTAGPFKQSRLQPRLSPRCFTGSQENRLEFPLDHLVFNAVA
jgi:hypothetical protein